ncbi:MAG: UDP-N-acetylglucosamine 2-epimerase [Chloroflexi bacterium]|nr:UDP-N-acetylglucosamine 2-epimerase [Chloroflexota bacterium]
MTKVCVVTGTRAEYGLLKPIMRAIQSTSGLELQLLVTGMHLAPEYGNSIEEIRRDGFVISSEVSMLIAGSTPGAQAKGIGLGIIGIAQAIETLRPDVMVVLGDRGEPLAAAIAGIHLNVPVVHLHGGESSYGSVDEPVRHAITRLAHIHLVANERAAERVRAMGEEEWRIHVVGAPGLDSIVNARRQEWRDLQDRLGRELRRPFVVVVQHPETVGIHDTQAQMHQILTAVDDTELDVVVIYPNADAGSFGIISAIQEFENKPGFHCFRNLAHEDYLGLLQHAKALLGNSSSGIIEAPSVGLPVVNIGLRQAGRERAENVIDADYDVTEIRQALAKALTDQEFRAQARRARNPYGDGRTGPRVAELLSTVPLDARLLLKRLTV